MHKATTLIFAGVLTLVTFGSALASVRLLETGSSLLYPLMNLWVADYQRVDHDVEITTQSTGSGTGISQAVAGVAQVGASDAYMSDAQMQQTHMLNIPLAISAQQINYNVPGLNDRHLRLSGPVLAGIYGGRIGYWDDPQLRALNHGISLPHQPIVPIHRADGSGDTFLFTQYLSKSTGWWNSGPAYGTTISWPNVSTAVGATGNPGMVQTCKSTPYSIAYIGVSFLNQTNGAHLGYAALQNRDGHFVLPDAGTIGAAAHALEGQTPSDERLSLVFAPGSDSYPIINYEYAIVNPHQPDGTTATALRSFLNWALSENGGQQSRYLDQVHFLPLPSSVLAQSRRQIGEVR